MPNKRIDQLNQRLNPLTGDELIPIFNVNGGDTERITLNTLTSYIGSGDTYVTGLTYTLSASTLTIKRNDGINLSTIITSKLDSIPSYSDDTEAGLSGLTSGDIYQTNGMAASPLNIAGILMVKQ